MELSSYTDKLLTDGLQTYRVFEIELNKRDSLYFSSIFISAQPAPVLGNTDLRYHLSRLNQNPQHISCSVYWLSRFRVIRNLNWIAFFLGHPVDNGIGYDSSFFQLNELIRHFCSIDNDIG